MNSCTNPMYRMPVFFGPSTGPRRGPDGASFDGAHGYDAITHTYSFLGDPEQLRTFLPPRFALYADPVVTVFAKYMRNIPWLAGRGYNLLGVTMHAVFQGARETVPGSLLLVLWENMTEPILTGREELGYAKIYCELPEPRRIGDEILCTACWDGFTFMRFSMTNVRPPTEDENMAVAARSADLQGTLHYKYIPCTGDWGKPDVEQAILGPKSNPEMRVVNTLSADGEAVFYKAAWQDMPTQYMIVNALADLTVRENLGVRITESVGSKDLSDMRRLW